MQQTADAVFELLSLRCVTSSGGTEYRNHDNLLHRVYGPAVIRDDGCEFWFFEGKQHRIGGAAARFPDGSLKYYLHGKAYPETSYWRIMALKNIYP